MTQEKNRSAGRGPGENRPEKRKEGRAPVLTTSNDRPTLQHVDRDVKRLIRKPLPRQEYREMRKVQGTGKRRKVKTVPSSWAGVTVLACIKECQEGAEMNSRTGRKIRGCSVRL